MNSAAPAFTLEPEALAPAALPGRGPARSKSAQAVDGEGVAARLAQWGPQGLSTAELVACIMRTESVDLAGRVLAVAESSPAGASLQDLQAVPGVGPSTAGALLAAVEYGRRASLKAAKRSPWRFNGSRQVFEFCREHLAGRQQEAFLVAGLDAKNRLIGSRVVSVGTLTQSLVHPREVFQPIIAMRAAGVIIAHNHPSGDPTPSPEDMEVTRRLKACADLLAVTLVDHLVVGAEKYYSFADCGWKF